MREMYRKPIGVQDKRQSGPGLGDVPNEAESIGTDGDGW